MVRPAVWIAPWTMDHTTKVLRAPRDVGAQSDWNSVVDAKHASTCLGSCVHGKFTTI